MPICLTGKLLIPLLLAVLTSNIAYSQTAINTDEYEKIFITQHAQYIVSPPSIKSASDIADQLSASTLHWRASAFQQNVSIEQLANVWFRLTLHNPSRQQQNLFFVGGDPNMPWFQLSIYKNDELLQRKTDGANFAFSDRAISHRLFLEPLILAPGESITLIIGTSNHSAIHKIWIESQASFWSDENPTTLTDGIYLGTILLIAIMSSLLYITDRDRLHLYIYIIIVGNTIYHFCRNGYAQQYLWPTVPGISNDWAIATLSLCVLGGILFSVRFLNLASQKQRWPYAISICYLVITIGIVPANFLLPIDISIPLLKLSANMATVYFSLLWLHSAGRSLSRDSRAIVYSIVWLIYLVPLLTPVVLAYLGRQHDLLTTLLSRNSDMFLAIELWAALLFHVRKTHREKDAAIVESKAKSAFLATMSHELRTPLNGVIGMGELLHETEQTPLQRHYSDVIVSSGNVLLTLINDILDLAKINDGKLEFEKKPFRLDTMLPECTSSFIPEMLKQKTHLNATITTDTPFHFIGDEYRLRQILFNLLSNAMKFTESGSVRVIASAKASQDPQSVIVTFEVIDTGIGIEQKALEHIFDQFSQADASTTRRFGGTGLGLAITKAIVEQMHGTITARSTPGHGSTFTVCLPMQVDLQAEKKRIASLTALSGKRVLAVQDTPHVFDNIDHHIKSWNMPLDIVFGVEAANDKLKQHRHGSNNDYDIVIAYFMHDTQKRLQALKDLGKPLIIFHHCPLDTQNIQWHQKTCMLSIPVSIGKLSKTFLDLLANDHCARPLKPIALKPTNPLPSSVLVVEDNITNQLVIKGMLKHLGITPDIANNGQEAVEMAASHQYQVILMDCEMPVMDGFKASRIIMNSNSQAKPYIAALTAHALDNTTEQCKKSGIQYVLHKPITVQRLKEFFSSLELISERMEIHRE